MSFFAWLDSWMWAASDMLLPKTDHEVYMFVGIYLFGVALVCWAVMRWGAGK